MNTHAKLSLEVTRKLIRSVDAILKDSGSHLALTNCMEQAHNHYAGRSKFGNPPNSLESTPTKLESFIVYLIRNGANDYIVKLALLEQFSLPGKWKN